MDRLTQVLLVLFGEEACIITDATGRPTALRITIQLDSDTAALRSLLKEIEGDTEGMSTYKEAAGT